MIVMHKISTHVDCVFLGIEKEHVGDEGLRRRVADREAVHSTFLGRESHHAIDDHVAVVTNGLIHRALGEFASETVHLEGKLSLEGIRLVMAVQEVGKVRDAVERIWEVSRLAVEHETCLVLAFGYRARARLDNDFVFVASHDYMRFLERGRLGVVELVVRGEQIRSELEVGGNMYEHGL
jgi:hypothetical protein